MQIRPTADLFGRALLEYLDRDCSPTPPVHLRRMDGRLTELPLAGYFDLGLFSDMETALLSMARGRVLDLGAGAGRAALYLQDQCSPAVSEVVAVDSSPGACECMQRRGVRQVINASWQQYLSSATGARGGELSPAAQFDSVLLLGSGLGMSGSPAGLSALLAAICRSLRPGGRALLTASRPETSSAAVGRMRVEYRGMLGNWFDWLFIDETSVRDVVRGPSSGWLGGEALSLCVGGGQSSTTGTDSEYGLVLTLPLRRSGGGH